MHIFFCFKYSLYLIPQISLSQKMFLQFFAFQPETKCKLKLSFINSIKNIAYNAPLNFQTKSGQINIPSSRNS